MTAFCPVENVTESGVPVGLRYPECGPGGSYPRSAVGERRNGFFCQETDSGAVCLER